MPYDPVLGINTEDLGPLPKLHPRMGTVTHAEFDISDAVWTVMKEQNLSYLEALTCVNRVAADLLRYALRVERHPDDPEKKGDEE